MSTSPRYARQCRRRVVQRLAGAAMALAFLSPAAAGDDIPERPAGSPGGPDATPPTAAGHVEVEGTIRGIEPLAKAIRVSGARSAGRDIVLQVIDRTRIHVGGRASGFTDLRQGDIITASYEDRYGISVTGSIDVRSRSR